MKAMIYRLPASLLLLASAAAAQPQPKFVDTTPCDKIAERVTVPDDFSITYRSGPVMASLGTSTITKLNAAGQVTIQSIRRSGMKKEEKVGQKQISKEAVQRVYAVVVACHFFEMEKSYWNRNVMDGWVSGLDVTAGGKSHGINVHHYAVTRFGTIVSALNATIEKQPAAQR